MKPLTVAYRKNNKTEEVSAVLVEFHQYNKTIDVYTRYGEYFEISFDDIESIY